MKQIQTKDYFRLVQDDDAHWYCIPAHLEDKFNEWVEAMGNYEDYEPDFGQYRLNMHPNGYVFTDFKEG